ncbi:MULTISPECIES: IS5 family transposase [Streptomyces]|uniref:IS5 family transposase n=1 Tax=Streptomyces TaxID=1883 RepID=UPI002021C94E|nr:IS5 family transposase [Streptomyces sp. MCA2]MCL7493649.1 IS5 family transposase [Streptomyces sp. MCA2]
MLHTGIQWEWLPQELGFGSGMTCWRRAAGLARGRGVGPAAPGPADRAAPGREARLVAGGDRWLASPGTSGRPKTGPSPVDRARPGSKHHVITDSRGTPLAITLTGGNRHDVTQLLPLLDAIPRVKGRTGRPRHRLRQLFADRGYDYDKYRRLLWKRGIKPVIAGRGVPHGSGLGTVRWVVEHRNAWIHGFRRLRIRWGIRDDIHEAFLKLACCVITYRRIRALC